MAEDIQDWRLIPYLQQYEIEALVLACLPSLQTILGESSREGIDALQRDIAGLTPEDVNNGKETAPSKRLAKHLPGYRKTLYGPSALNDAGLAHIRGQCSLFSAWLTTLENLAPSGLAL